jgi:hypothetical protein
MLNIDSTSKFGGCDLHDPQQESHTTKSNVQVIQSA